MHMLSGMYTADEFGLPELRRRGLVRRPRLKVVTAGRENSGMNLRARTIIWHRLDTPGHESARVFSDQVSLDSDWYRSICTQCATMSTRKNWADWFPTFRGPVGYEIRDLSITTSDRLLSQDRRPMDDLARAFLCANVHGAALQGGGRSEALVTAQS